MAEDIKVLERRLDGTRQSLRLARRKVRAAEQLAQAVIASKSASKALKEQAAELLA